MAKNDKAGKTAKQSKETNKLFSIYGARQSNSGERVNISLLRGQDDEREWATITIKDSKGKKAEDGKVYARTSKMVTPIFVSLSLTRKKQKPATACHFNI